MKTIAVIFGGRSAEHDVSIITALLAIIHPLEVAGEYQVEPVYISKDGSWYWDAKLKDITLYQGDGLTDFLQKTPKAQLLFDNGLTLVRAGKLGSVVRCKVDVAFPAMHGTYGEDGALMGLLDMAGVPYVGCGLQAAAIAMDKITAKQVTGAAGIPSTPWVSFTASELAQDPKSIQERIKPLAYPLFVKPTSLGSSIGISRVTDESQLMNALEVACHFDTRVIVEQGVANLIEVTVPVMGNDTPEAALVEQPLTKPDDFFDFETKYINQGGKKGGKTGGSKSAQGYSNLPADIPQKLYVAAEKLALDTYKALGCTGIARIDLLIDGKTEAIYFNEANPLPGSLYAHNWQAKGISNYQLVTRLIALAEERHAARQKIQTAFRTNFLKQF